jgi:GGDEF domain-containing protein
MPAESVRIDELILRAPGLTEEEARRMGEEVARRISGSLPVQGRVARLGALELRLTIPYGIPRERLAEQIAQAILEKLR